MAIDEIEPKTATFDDIERFVSNLRQVGSGTEVEIAYFTTQTQVILSVANGRVLRNLHTESTNPVSLSGRGSTNLIAAWMS